MAIERNNPPRLIHIIGATRWRDPWRHALDVCRHFRDIGWSVTAYTRDMQAIDSRFRESGIDLRHSPLRGVYDVWSAVQLASHLRYEQRNTIVHVHRYRDAFGVLLARKIANRPDIRVVNTHHELIPGKRYYTARSTYRNLDAHIFVSAAVLDSFLSAWSDANYPFDISRTHIIMPAVNLPDQPPLPEPEKGPKIILCRAAMEPGNGVETLIDAMVHLRGMKTRLWLVGEGNSDYIDTLRRRAQTRGVMDMIDWKLRLTPTSSLIDMSHICVDPSYTNTALGPSHIEIMARKRALVLSSAIEPSEYVSDNKEVMIVPRGNAATLGQVLISLVNDADKRVRIAANAHNTYQQHFSWSVAANAIAEVYDSCLAK